VTLSIARVDQDRDIAARRHILFAFRGRVRQTVRRRKQLEHGVGSDLLESPLLPFRRKRCDALVRDERRTSLYGKRNTKSVVDWRLPPFTGPPAGR
jgi:hypothetical protein